MMEENWGSQLEPVDWDDREREPFTRSFLEPLEEEPEDAALLREALDISVEDTGGQPIPRPVSRFEELSVLPDYTLQSLRDNGIIAPLPIQAQALPLVLSGHDVIGLAQTGSGKTLAFLLPAIVHMEAQRPLEWGAATPITLVLAPTRELAVQIAEEGSKVLRRSRAGNHRWGLQAVCLYGGGNKREQAKALSSGAQVVVATPGRLIDFVTTQVVSLERVTYFVLDEADRMLDMGFQSDVAVISGQVRPERQVLFFSATWSRSVQELALGLCRNGSHPVRISVKQPNSGGSWEEDAASSQARESIVQEVVVVDFPQDYARQEAEKQRLLEEYLNLVLSASKRNKVLVFVSQKKFADDLCTKLWEAGFSTGAMHGGKAQESRLWTLDCFRKGELQLLVATDVVGRGIDIPSVTHVVVFDMGSCEDYVHRIGRTARGKDAKGCALVFFEYYYKDPGLAAGLVGVLEASRQPVPSGLSAIAQQVARGERDVWDSNANWGRGTMVPGRGASAAAKEGLGVQGSWDRHLGLLVNEVEEREEEAPSSRSGKTKSWRGGDGGRDNRGYPEYDATSYDDQKWKGNEDRQRRGGNNSAYGNRANTSYQNDTNGGDQRRRGANSTNGKANNSRANGGHDDASSHDKGKGHDDVDGGGWKRGRNSAATDSRPSNGRSNGGSYYGSSHNKGGEDNADDDQWERGKSGAAHHGANNGNGTHRRGNGNNSNNDQRWNGETSTDNNNSNRGNNSKTGNEDTPDRNNPGNNFKEQRWADCSDAADTWSNDNGAADSNYHDRTSGDANYDDDEGDENYDNAKHEDRWRGNSSTTSGSNARMTNSSPYNSHADRGGDASGRSLKSGRSGGSDRRDGSTYAGDDSSGRSGGRWSSAAAEQADGWAQPGMPVGQWLALVDPSGGMEEFLPALRQCELETVEQVLARYSNARSGEFAADNFFRDMGMKKFKHKQLVRRWLRQQRGE